MFIKKNYLIAPLRVLAVIVWMIIMPVLFMLARMVKLKGFENIPNIFHKGLRFIMGIRVSFTGELNQTKPTLYVSNHISYLDILVLGDLKAYFIAKAEVASWPVIGKLAEFQNTLFIERRAGRARHQLSVMQQHLNNSKNLILFPEGTSTDGVHVDPFKSSLFEAANLAALNQTSSLRVAIQPITIAYTHQADQKMNRQMLDHYAWYAEMPFGSHAARLFALKKVDVKVHYHPVCYIDDFETRKHCADYCQEIVADKLDEFIA